MKTNWLGLVSDRDLRGRHPFLHDALQGNADQHAAAHRLIGAVVWGACFSGLAGYLITDHPGFFAMPLVGLTVAWRLVLGHWPFLGRRSSEP